MPSVTPPRELSQAEAAVIGTALDRAPVGEVSPELRASLTGLRVVGRCVCGCASLFFAGIEAAAEQYRVADGLAYAEDGEEIGIILWASRGNVVHMELYNYAEHPARLPEAESVCAFEQARRARE